MSLLDRIDAPSPKKLLALDGGGIRGMITVEVLADIEAKLRRKLRAGKDFVLADYFDYIAGTSTGAILAAGLSFGLPVDRLRRFYVEDGKKMFDKASLWRRWKTKFESDELAGTLQDIFGTDTQLGTDKLKTLLMMVLRNASTDSPWPISNNPRAKYNQPTRCDNNLKLPLWQLVRASTAAPTYFPPERVELGGGKEFVFVDGGVTMYNNPAFQLFLMATLDVYKLGWTPGESTMLLVSVGTGTNPGANANLSPDEMNIVYNATSIPSALMFGALTEQDFLCRVFGKCREGDLIDREVGDVCPGEGPLTEKLFTYIRYNVTLTDSGLKKIGVTGINARNIQSLDAVGNISDLQTVGKAVADTYVNLEHFEGFL